MITATAAALLPLSSCFTGIESTPRIEAPRNVQTLTDDDRNADNMFLSDVVAAPFETWNAGKRFAVVDNRFSLLLGATAPVGKELGGTTISWIGSRTVSTVTGSKVTELLFADNCGDTLIYRAPSERVGLIPFLVDTDVIGHVDSLLRGHTVWTRTQVWRDLVDAPVRGRKFIPVMVDSVVAGNADCSLRVCFTAADGESPSEGYFFLEPGSNDATKSVRRFATLMSLTDPRLRYPGIDDAVWRCIVHGDVMPGMTRDQVRVAIGSPRDVNTLTGNGASSTLVERWIYDTGRIVTFEDGIVVKRRH